MSTKYDSYGFSAYPQTRPKLSAPLAHLEPVVRTHLRRVYTSLCTALLCATVGSVITLELYARRFTWPGTLATFLTIPTLLAFQFQAPHSSWRAPLFYLFAFVDGAAAAPLLSHVAAVDPRIPTIAFMGAAAVFACCTLSALFAKRRSYLFLGSVCTTALTGLFFVSLVSLFWSSFRPFSLTIYGGLLVFCMFVLYDTQVIIEKARDGNRDHLRHALELLIDFIAIFKRLAIIIAKNSAERERNDDRRKRSRN